MNPLTAIFLGAVQGLTEFLPVSSSGHLVLAQRLIPGFSQPGVLFDVVLHAGTLLAVLAYFRKTLLSMKVNYLVLLGVGTIPAVILGYLFSDLLESLFKDIKLLSFGFLITGALNLLIDKLQPKKRKIGILGSLFVGVFQALAIVPSVSRSGSTIFAGIVAGLDRKKAAEFSFLLSIPAILGANVLQIVKYGASFDIPKSSYLIGFIVAAITGYLSIKAVYFFLLSKNFKLFAYYTFILGILILLFFSV